jgi:hypothetical protein
VIKNAKDAKTIQQLKETVNRVKHEAKANKEETKALAEENRMLKEALAQHDPAGKAEHLVITEPKSDATPEPALAEPTPEPAQELSSELETQP